MSAARREPRTAVSFFLLCSSETPACALLFFVFVAFLLFDAPGPRAQRSSARRERTVPRGKGRPAARVGAMTTRIATTTAWAVPSTLRRSGGGPAAVLALSGGILVLVSPSVSGSRFMECGTLLSLYLVLCKTSSRTWFATLSSSPSAPSPCRAHP